MFTINYSGRDYKVDFMHNHFENEESVHYQGSTICTISEVNGKDIIGEVASGESFCSKTDKFLKATGRKISLKRALENLNLGNEIKPIIWMNYYQRTNEQRNLESLQAELDRFARDGKKIKQKKMSHEMA